MLALVWAGAAPGGASASGAPPSRAHPPTVTREPGVVAHNGIDAIYEDFRRAYRTLDADLVAGVYTEDALYLGPGGEIQRGRAEIRKGFDGTFSWARENGSELDITFRIVDRKLEGRLGHDVGIYTMVRSKGGRVVSSGRGKFVVATARGTDGRWRFHVDGYSDLPPPPLDPALRVPAGEPAAADPALTRARDLLARVPLIDGHNDVPWSIRKSKGAPMDVAAYDLTKATSPDTDIPRLRAGRVGAQFWSVFIPGKLENGRYALTQLEQIDIARRLIARYPDDLQLCLTANDVERAFAAGRIGSLLGLEGGQAIESSLGALRAYYDLGARYMTLTHNVTLDWADAATGEARHGGLTAFGREVVREMNRLGMLVDLSHVSPETMHDALEVSEAPVIFSHSSARAVVDHPRNVPDGVLRRLKENGGVAMVTFVPVFVSPEVWAWWEPIWKEAAAASTAEEFARLRRERTAAAGPEPKATLAQVADHIEHVRKVAGADHVGIGGDYGAASTYPTGLEDVSRYPDLFAELIRRGWSDADLTKLAGGNLLRAMRRAEEVSGRLRRERPASTATIEGLDRK